MVRYMLQKDIFIDLAYAYISFKKLFFWLILGAVVGFVGGYIYNKFYIKKFYTVMFSISYLNSQYSKGLPYPNITADAARNLIEESLQGGIYAQKIKNYYISTSNHNYPVSIRLITDTPSFFITNQQQFLNNLNSSDYVKEKVISYKSMLNQLLYNKIKLKKIFAKKNTSFPNNATNSDISLINSLNDDIVELNYLLDKIGTFVYVSKPVILEKKVYSDLVNSITISGMLAGIIFFGVVGKTRKQ